jgi:hypothetical protein
VSLTATVLRWVVRLTGLLQLAIGLALWSGNLLQYFQLHVLDGFVFTLALLAIVVLAAFLRIGPGPVMVGIVLVVVLPVLGMTQLQILPGNLHWIVQVVHLLVGVAAIGFADWLAGKVVAGHSRRDGS